MIPSNSLYVTPKQDYLHSIHFHSFQFLYFKTSNQGYLIPFHSLIIIPLYSIPLRTSKRSLKAYLFQICNYKSHNKHYSFSLLLPPIQNPYVKKLERQNKLQLLEYWNYSAKMKNSLRKTPSHTRK